MIKVGVVGYGTVGKRVADAVMLQDDMELVGVTVRSFNHRVLAAHRKKIPLFTVGTDDFGQHGITPNGTFDDLLQEADIVVDATPKPYGEKNVEQYRKHGVKAILQGGEKAEAAECSFNAQSNYDDAKGKDVARVVSCNTTALSRVLGSLAREIEFGHICVTLMRRAADPAQTGKTTLNAIQPGFQFPSHHGPDVNTILPSLEIFSMAWKVPTTLMHAHSIEAELKNPVETEKVLSILRDAPRVHLVHSKAGADSTAHVMELGKDLGYHRGDFMEAAVWENGVRVVGNRLYLMMAVHQESIVVPENIDCIRAMMNAASREESIAKTDRSLGIATKALVEH